MCVYIQGVICKELSVLKVLERVSPGSISQKSAVRSFSIVNLSRDFIFRIFIGANSAGARPPG